MTSEHHRWLASSWVSSGTVNLLSAVHELSDSELDDATALPGWTRRHLLAHLASNAEALQRLASWAATGVESRMYASSEQRNKDIESGSQRPAASLREWVRSSAHGLAADLDSLGQEAWQAEVVTAQGRTVPATEIPWMRAREVLVHGVDLGAGLTFADLPQDFLVALLDDVTAKRSKAGTGPALILRTDGATLQWTVSGSGQPVEVTAPLPELAAWLSGRPHSIKATGLPQLPPWL